MFNIVSDFVRVASFFRGVKRRKQLERPWKDVWVGGVVLIKFPGGFRALQTVTRRVIFFMFFLLISVPRFCRHFVDFGTSFGISFRAFWRHFGVLFPKLIFEWIYIDFLKHFGMFFEDFFILFLHSLENVDFIKIAVFLQENNVFHGSEGSKILYLSLFFEAF